MLCAPPAQFDVPPPSPISQRSQGWPPLCALITESVSYAGRLHRALPGGGQLLHHPVLANPPRRLARLIRGIRRAWLLLLILSGQLRCLPNPARAPRPPRAAPTCAGVHPARPPDCRRAPSIRIDPDRPIGALIRSICADLAIPVDHDLFPVGLAQATHSPAEHSAMLFGALTGPPPPVIPPPDLLAGTPWLLPLRGPPRPRPGFDSGAGQGAPPHPTPIVGSPWAPPDPVPTG